MIAAIHGACVGGGIDLISACDLRYCTADALFSVKGIDVGMTADVGTLQRLPQMSARAWRTNWVIRAARSAAREANEMRLVNRARRTARR